MPDNRSQRLFRTLPYVLFITLAAPLAAQSELECQDASKWHAEQDLIQQLFNGLWEGTKADGAPALGDTSGERAENRSLQTRVRDGIRDCQANGGATEACGNYHRIRNAWLENNAGGSPDAAMVTDPQTCKILDPDSGAEITAANRPEGYDGVVWQSRFRHEQYHQFRCRDANGSGANYEPGGEPSPYLQRMSDPRQLAEEEITAHAMTQGVLEDYLRENCFDPELIVDADDMTGKCGESVNGDVNLRSVASSAGSYVVNTLSNLLGVHTTGAVDVPANGDRDVPISGDCFCCDATTMSGQVRVYGGPGHSILVGDDDANIGCTKGNKCAGMSGDPHMRTYDGLRFDFQGAGEFVLARGEHFELQARLEGWPGGKVSLGMAAAVRLHGDAIALYSGKPPRVVVMGVPTILEVGEGVRLPGGALIMREERRYSITTPEGFVLEARPTSNRVDVKVGLPYEWRSFGLLGDLDGDRANDIRSSEGAILLQPAEFEELYKVFGASWRVTAETSLFEYGEGESADSFWDPNYPKQKVRGRDITGEARRKAEQVCRAAGVTDPVNLEDCILDVAVTGDAGFAEGAAAQPAGDGRLEVRGGPPAARASPAEPSGTGEVTLEAPSEAPAAHRVEVRTVGLARMGDWVGFAPVGSGPGEKVENPSSGAATSYNRDVTQLAVPTVPGDYELRYVAKVTGEQEILARQPFRSLPPRVRLEAAETAEATLPLTVRLFGDVGEHMQLVVVRAGSDEPVPGAEASLRQRQGSEAEALIRRLPAEAGEYEILLVSNWNGGQRIYARRGLTLHAASAVELAAPSEGLAAHKIEVRISGLARSGDWVGFAPAGSGPDGKAGNPYSASGTNGRKDVFQLVVPTIPGDYELRYREKNGRELKIIARQPFRSIAPNVALDAAGSAEAGASLPVRVTGDVGEHMKLSIVPAGGDKQVAGAAASLKEGTEANVTIRRLPAAPGEYELLCVSNWGGGRHVYARRPLTIR